MDHVCQHSLKCPLGVNNEALQNITVPLGSLKFSCLICILLVFYFNALSKLQVTTLTLHFNSVYLTNGFYRAAPDDAFFNGLFLDVNLSINSVLSEYKRA